MQIYPFTSHTLFLFHSSLFLWIHPDHPRVVFAAVCSRFHLIKWRSHSLSLCHILRKRAFKSISNFGQWMQFCKFLEKVIFPRLPKPLWEDCAFPTCFFWHLKHTHIKSNQPNNSRGQKTLGWEDDGRIAFNLGLRRIWTVCRSQPMCVCLHRVDVGKYNFAECLMKTHFWRAIFGTHVALALQKRSAFCATIKSVDELKPKKKQIFWNFWTAQQKAQIEFEVMAQKHHNLIWFERLTLSQNPREHLRANGQFHSKLSTPIPLFPIRSEIATTIGGPYWFVTLVLGSSWVFLVIRWPRKPQANNC